jgi:hypothetical protein
MCEKTALPRKGYCAEHKERFACVQCQQEIWNKGTTISIGDKYIQQEGTTKNRHLC